MTKTPSLTEWKALYDAAIEFQKLRCWEWMSDSEIFGVQNPENKEISYCCIMGKMHKYYALMAYKGSEGLWGYFRLQSSGFDSEESDVLFIQNGLMVSYENRDFLVKEDLEIIKQLGLKFRGQNNWPMFRNYAPGLYPWFINSDEARFLTIVLEQASIVAQRLKNNPFDLFDEENDSFFTRVLEQTESGLQWCDRWISPEPPQLLNYYVVEWNEEKVENLLKSVKRTNMVLEYDLSFLSIPMKSEKSNRPFFPRMVLCVDKETKFIIDAHLLEFNSSKQDILQRLIESLKNIGILPKEIHVIREEIYDILFPFADHFGIVLKVVKTLPILQGIKKSFLQRAFSPFK